MSNCTTFLDHLKELLKTFSVPKLFLLPEICYFLLLWLGPIDSLTCSVTLVNLNAV